MPIVLHPSSALSQQQRACTANTSPQCAHRAVGSSHRRGNKRWKWFMWCYVVLLCKSATTSKQIYVSYTTQNVTSEGKIWVKGFILSSLSFRSVKGSWFMGLLLVSVRPCVCWNTVSVCVGMCVSFPYQTAGLAPLCSGHSTRTGRLNSDWWRSEFCTNQNRQEKTHMNDAQQHTLKHLDYPDCTSSSFSTGVSAARFFQFAPPLFHHAIFRNNGGPQRADLSPSNWPSNLNLL